MEPWIYALVCLVVPAAWGTAMYFVFGAWERRRRPPPLADRPPPIDYSI